LNGDIKANGGVHLSHRFARMNIDLKKCAAAAAKKTLDATTVQS
jgi:hypothetical protein